MRTCPQPHTQLHEPLVANLISGTAIVALGDVISQMIERNEEGKRKCTSLSQVDGKRVFNAGE